MQWCVLNVHTLCDSKSYPANTRRSSNVVSMLGHRLRRWSNIETTLVERPVYASLLHELLIMLLSVICTWGLHIMSVITGMSLDACDHFPLGSNLVNLTTYKNGRFATGHSRQYRRYTSTILSGLTL